MCVLRSWATPPLLLALYALALNHTAERWIMRPQTNSCENIPMLGRVWCIQGWWGRFTLRKWRVPKRLVSLGKFWFRRFSSRGCKAHFCLRKGIKNGFCTSSSYRHKLSSVRMKTNTLGCPTPRLGYWFCFSDFFFLRLNSNVSAWTLSLAVTRLWKSCLVCRWCILENNRT